MIQSLTAKSEGPNTFWAKTVWESIKEARYLYPEVLFRQNPETNEVEELLAHEEGPNTFWVPYSEHDKMEDFVRAGNSPVDERMVLREFQ